MSTIPNTLTAVAETWAATDVKDAGIVKRAAAMHAALIDLTASGSTQKDAAASIAGSIATVVRGADKSPFRIGPNGEPKGGSTVLHYTSAYGKLLDASLQPARHALVFVATLEAVARSVSGGAARIADALDAYRESKDADTAIAALNGIRREPKPPVTKSEDDTTTPAPSNPATIDTSADDFDLLAFVASFAEHVTPLIDDDNVGDVADALRPLLVRLGA